MVRLAVILALMVGVVPAAQAATRIELVARVTGGLIDGGKILLGTLGVGSVRQDAANSFEISFSNSDERASFIFEEPKDCVFVATSAMKGWPTTRAQYNMRFVTETKLTDQGKWEGLNAMLLELTGAPGIVLILRDEPDPPMETYPVASLVTSMTVDEIKAAATELDAACAFH